MTNPDDLEKAMNDPSGGQIVTAAQTYGGLRTINAIAHSEDGIWWAESQQVPALGVSAPSRDELFRMALEGLRFYLGTDQFNFAMWDELPPGAVIAA